MIPTKDTHGCGVSVNILQVPEISTAHITLVDADILEEASFGFNKILSYEEGFFLCVIEPSEYGDIHNLYGQQLSLECLQLLRKYHDLGYLWIRLDRDADVDGYHPTFEW